jgi:hypothetical protein
LSSGISNGYNEASAAASTFGSANSSSLSKETERSLIGSLVDSYGFKEEGLVKKTVSVTVGGVSHHLVSYYTVADVMNKKFSTPTADSRFQHITPRLNLITKQNFRSPIDEVDNPDQINDRSVYNAYPYAYNGYEITNQSISHRPISLPTLPITYSQPSSLFGNYIMPLNSAYSDRTSIYKARELRQGCLLVMASAGDGGVSSFTGNNQAAVSSFVPSVTENSLDKDEKRKNHRDNKEVQEKARMDVLRASCARREGP